jgi:hypothetical protein
MRGRGVSALWRRGTTGWRLAVFTAAVVAAWALLAWPAHRLDGRWGLAGSGVAAGLCLVPGWITLYVSGRLRGPASAAFAALGGMVLRLVFVLGAGTGVYFAVDGFTPRNLLLWLVVFYGITLALETALVLGPISRSIRHDGR